MQPSVLASKLTEVVPSLAHLVADLHHAQRPRAERNHRHERVAEDVEVRGEDGRGEEGVLDGLRGVHDLRGRGDVARDTVGEEDGVGGGDEGARSASKASDESG